MQYRTLGKTGLSVSALGFGAMRLPTCGSESAVDEPRAIEMIRYAIDHGVNYLDTAYVYHGGNGEAVVGRALADGYRDRVQLATKLPAWSVTSLADCDRILDEQLTRLRTDHIDCYLLHCLQKRWWPQMLAVGVLDWLRHGQRAGKIGRIGFSFHDDYAYFVEIVEAFAWDFCQIQYNFVCEEAQAGTAGLEFAAGRGLGVIVMEPLFGGTLANPPPSVQALWDAVQPPCRPADLALQWVWNKPAVSLVLSGMSTLEQVQQNLESAERSRSGGLTAEQSQLIARVRDEYQRLAPIPCTKCGYCLPCPHGVNIPVNFELFNQAKLMGGASVQLCRNLYLSLPEAEQAAACQECGLCEEQCPQHLAIRQLLPQVPEQFR